MSDRAFTGSIPEVYERFLVPLIFQPYATDLAARLSSLRTGSVLEVAAGTGVLTRAMADHLPPSVHITATDLNQPMLDRAIVSGTSRPIEWRTADVMDLPAASSSFDAVVCQFGAMFFPDRAAAFAEVRRVLRSGGLFLFNVWDRIEANEFASIVTTALAELFPNDPPMFLARVPHGYHDPDTIRADLRDAGFSTPATLTTVHATARAESAHSAALAYCQGTPLRNEILARDPGRLDEATSFAAAAIAGRCGQRGRRDVVGRIGAHVLTAVAP